MVCDEEQARQEDLGLRQPEVHPALDAAPRRGVAQRPLVVIAEKVDPEWTAKVGGIIEEMKKDGTLGQLTTKWYGKDYSTD